MGLSSLIVSLTGYAPLVDEDDSLVAAPGIHAVFVTQLIVLSRGRLLDFVPARATSASAWPKPRTRACVTTSTSAPWSSQDQSRRPRLEAIESR